MFFRLLAASLGVIAIVLTDPACLAENASSAGTGHFSGRVEAGLLYLRTTNQLSAFHENKRNHSLSNDAGLTSSLGLPILFELRYRFNDNRTSVYTETPNENIGGAISFGVTHTFKPDADLLDVSVNFEPNTVWKNPYDVVDSREDTSIYNSGLKIEWDKIYASRFTLDYELNRADVDQDVIGHQFDSLKRDGQTHKLGFTYTMPYNTLNSFIPGVYYIRADIDGKSNRYQGMRAELAYMREKAEYGIYTFISLDHNRYDATHPLFFKKRSEDIYSAGLIVTFYKAFHIRNAFTRLGVGYEYGEANIDFFGYHTIACGFSLGYFF